MEKEHERQYLEKIRKTAQAGPFLPDSVWLCALLCEQPPDPEGNPSVLRSGYLRRPQ